MCNAFQFKTYYTGRWIFTELTINSKNTVSVWYPNNLPPGQFAPYIVAGLRNGHVHVFTRSLQSKATNVSLGLVMYFKKQTFFFFQEIITL